MNNIFKHCLLIQKLNLNAKKEYSKIFFYHVLLMGMAIFSFFLFNLLISLSFLGIGIIIINLYINYQYQIKIEFIDNERTMAFIEAFSIFKILIDNNFNVYSAFEETTKYVGEWMHEQIDDLLIGIDNDKTITPFIKFAQQFKPLVIQQLMTSIYQISNEGVQKAYLHNFVYLFDQFEAQQISNDIRKYEERLDGLNLLPLMGAGIFGITLLLGVVSIIGRVISEL
jgi:hypothetical protein